MDEALPPPPLAELLGRAQAEKKALEDLRSENTPERKTSWASCCEENFSFIAQFVQSHGWPAEYGAQIENAAFLLVQHGDAAGLLPKEKIQEIAAQKTVIIDAMKQGSAMPGYVAFVTDRMHWNRQEPQIYGTVPSPDYPVRNLAEMDNLRVTMQLGENHKEYLTRMQTDDVPYRKIFDPSKEGNFPNIIPDALDKNRIRTK